MLGGNYHFFLASLFVEGAEEEDSDGDGDDDHEEMPL
jgi:hypothetical protein